MSYKKIAFGSIVIVIVIVNAVLFWFPKDASTPDIPAGNTNTVIINDVMNVVLPTTDTVTEVVVSAVTMPEPGFVVVREVDGTRLGQIVEISSYLEAGKHTNVTVSLGEDPKPAKNLVVMIYGDAQNDEIMNDLDRPLRTVNNLPIAYYVQSGESVPTDILANGFQADAIAVMEMGQSMPDMAMPMETIRYTNEGYVPANVTIKQGTMVMCINESDQDMWVASNGHPAHLDLPTFDQFEFSPKGSQYVYTFDQVGLWKYHDHIAPIYGGIITVTE
jgi:plastocyanin